MAQPVGFCPHCGSLAENVRLRAERHLIATSNDVRGTLRVFIGDCATHGQVFVVIKTGHHSTVGAKSMKRRYSDEARRRIWSHLSVDERKAFNRAVHGHRFPSRDDMAKWDRLAVLPALSRISAWLGRQIGKSG